MYNVFREAAKKVSIKNVRECTTLVCEADGEEESSTSGQKGGLQLVCSTGKYASARRGSSVRISRNNGHPNLFGEESTVVWSERKVMCLWSGTYVREN